MEQHGYLTRRRVCFENGRLGDVEYTIYEKPISREREADLSKRVNPEQEKSKQENPVQLNTDELNTHQSIYPAKPKEMDEIELVSAYREIIKEIIQDSGPRNGGHPCQDRF